MKWRIYKITASPFLPVNHSPLRPIPRLDQSIQMDPMLRDTAQMGNIDALYTLIEMNPHVLEGMEEIPFTDTPLHVAAARGHIEFAMLVMGLKPSFARKLNQNLNSPMHLALENGQIQMVLWLLKSEKGLVRVKGRDGKTPLHRAIELGEIDILVEFLMSCPECIRDVTARGESSLHIAAKANTAALEVLVGWLRRYCHKDAGDLEDQILNGTDMKGNTPLHVAAYENPQQALKLLAECRSVQQNIKNLEGLTAIEIIEQRRQSGTENNEHSQRILHLFQTSNHSKKKEKSELEHLRSKMSIRERIGTSLSRKRLTITNEMSNAMLVVAALIITVSFQGVLSPPGGVWQGSSGNNNVTSTICETKCNNSAATPSCSIICGNTTTTATNSGSSSSNAATSSEGQTHPGLSVMDPGTFVQYWLFNSIAFFLAAAVAIILVPQSFLGITLNFAFSFLFYSYTVSMNIISPSKALGIISWFLFPHIYPIIMVYRAFFWRIRYC